MTSRSTNVLLESGIRRSSIYTLTALGTEHSRELFCSYAFNQHHPVTELEDLVEKFLKACQGLPLSLRVLGAHLYGKKKDYWEAHLSKILPADISEYLRISYDSLVEEEKQIFLDITCSFIGEDRDMAIRVWDGNGWKGLQAFMNLQDKGLVEVDEENCIRMHDHVRDLGRHLAGSDRLRRVWRPTDYLLQNVFHQLPVCVLNL
jgi:hypothetical protein